MPQLFQELTDDFSQGMYDSVAPTRYPKAAVRIIYNGRVQPDGSVRRRPGNIRTSPAVLGSDIGYGGVSFTTAAGVDQIIVFVGSVAYKSENYGATWTSIATSLRQDYYSFATMRVGATNYLFCANGDTTIKSWDGTTWTTVTNAPSGVKYIAVFNSRLWATGHDGVLAQACKVATPTTWASPDGLTVQILTNSGDVPTGLFQIGPHLLVFDRHSTSYIDGFGEQTLITATGATGFSRSVGCVAFRSVVGVGDNGAAWLSERGVEFYSPGAGISLLSRGVQKFLKEIDFEELYSNPGRISAVYDNIEQDYQLALSTNGIRNNRLLVINLRQPNVEFQRTGRRGAPSIDVLASQDASVLFFDNDAQGYLTAAPGGVGSEVEADAQGYMSLVGAMGGGEPVGEDANGYLESITVDELPASLFVAPSSERSGVVYSVGYDGFVRRHYGVDKDDMSSDETGGTDVWLRMVSKPNIYKNPRQRKRVRRLHVSSLQETESSVIVQARARGLVGPEHTLTMLAYGLDHAYRGHAMTTLIGDTPQIEVRSADDVRITLLGMSCELMREPV